MRRLVGFAMFLVIAVAVIGIYRGWFTVTVNQARIDHDKNRVERKIERGTEKLKENVNVNHNARRLDQNTDNTDNSIPPPPPPPGA